MITEHGILEVAPGREEEFLASMGEAKALIATSPGFISLRVERGIERPNVFLLLVEWDRLEDHLEGFRGSAAFEQWRAALHHFYQPAPVIEHFEPVLSAEPLTDGERNDGHPRGASSPDPASPGAGAR